MKPKLRFINHSTHSSDSKLSDWETKKLGALFDEVNDRAGERVYALLSVSLSSGVTEQNPEKKRDTSSESKNKYKVVKPGDIAYNTMRMWQGASGIARLTGVVSPAYTVIRLKRGVSAFYGYLFKSSKTLYQFYAYSQGMTSDTWSIKFQHLSEVSVQIPRAIDEQQRIADFLSAVDKKISLLEKKRELLEKYKKGVMQQIFSQKIRFKDSNGNDYQDWHTRTLNEVFSYEQPSKYITTRKEYDKTGATPILTAGKTFILGYTDETEGIFTDPLPVVLFDDFTTSSKFVDFPFRVKSSAIKILKIAENIRPKIAYEILVRIRHQAGGHKRHWIGQFQHMQVSLPCLEEQIKIEKLTNSLDQKIELLNTAIGHWRLWKQGLLQGMFA